MISFSRHYRESSISILIYSLLPAEKEMQYSQRDAFAETRREQHGNDDRRQNEFGIGIGKQGAQSLIPTSSSGRTATMS